MKKIQLYRKLSQLTFLIILIIGFYADIRMVIILALPAAFIFGNFYCGWICPFGTLQDLFGLIGRKIFKKKFKMPRAIQKYLQFSRYILAIISVTGAFSIFFESINAYGTFLGVFLTPFTLTASSIVMISLVLIAILFDRPYCNYLCSEGIKFGVFSFTRIFSIKRNEDSCVSCKKCTQACPMNIEVNIKENIRNAQCINCFECISVCPVENTLTYGRVPFPNIKNFNK